MGDSREEEGSQAASYLLVDVLELRFFEVELVYADFVHGVVLDYEYSVCQPVDTAQTQASVVGLQDDLARKMRHHAAHNFGDLGVLLFKQTHHIGAQT